MSRRLHAAPSSTSPSSSSGQNSEKFQLLPSSKKYLQGRDDVTLGNAGHSAEVFDAEGAPEVPEDLEEDPGPVRPIRELSQVRQRLLWAASHL